MEYKGKGEQAELKKGVRLEVAENRRRLHIGSIFTDLNESDYQELVKIFSAESKQGSYRWVSDDEIEKEMKKYKSLVGANDSEMIRFLHGARFAREFMAPTNEASKPLSEITDEDAEQVGKRLHFATDLKHNGKIFIQRALVDKKDSGLSFHPLYVIDVYKYLISKGYSLPNTKN